jgi:hypothetical protein
LRPKVPEQQKPVDDFLQLWREDGAREQSSKTDVQT